MWWSLDEVCQADAGEGEPAFNERTGRPHYGYAVDRVTLGGTGREAPVLTAAGNAAPPSPTWRAAWARPAVAADRHVGAGSLAEAAAPGARAKQDGLDTDTLYGSLPARLSYAPALARMVKHEYLTPVQCDFRLFS